jgi:hypothetical protein
MTKSTIILFFIFLLGFKSFCQNQKVPKILNTNINDLNSTFNLLDNEKRFSKYLKFSDFNFEKFEPIKTSFAKEFYYLVYYNEKNEIVKLSKFSESCENNFEVFIKSYEGYKLFTKCIFMRIKS